VVQRTNYHHPELPNTRFSHYSSLVVILLKHAPLLRYSATVKVVYEAMNAARENSVEH
jgi:hypothetical protein